MLEHNFLCNQACESVHSTRTNEQMDAAQAHAIRIRQMIWEERSPSIDVLKLRRRDEKNSFPSTKNRWGTISKMKVLREFFLIKKIDYGRFSCSFR